ncbi:MAG: hypothetical protein ACPGWR_17955 [Ardenticatenaceae bacterium]
MVIVTTWLLLSFRRPPRGHACPLLPLHINGFQCFFMANVAAMIGHWLVIGLVIGLSLTVYWLVIGWSLTGEARRYR